MWYLQARFVGIWLFISITSCFQSTVVNLLAPKYALIGFFRLVFGVPARNFLLNPRNLPEFQQHQQTKNKK
jgi:hypothetical protein